jgi:polysaccharide chain length determinant protein (PEP-CTERM system associated)
MNERNVHPLDYLAVLKRRRAWFAIPLAASTVLSIALALFLPPTYRSSATIGVQAPAVILELVPAWAALNRDERLRALSQQLRSRTVLERVARDEGLTLEQPVEIVTQDLLKRITVEIPRPIPGTEGGGELNAFEIVYRDRTPERTRRVTDRLAQVFTDEHSRSRELQARGTAVFLASQVGTSQNRLSILEQELRLAKERHMGRLPEQTLVNLQSLAGVRQELETTHNSLQSERDRLIVIDQRLQSMKRAGNSGLSGAPSPQQRVDILQGQLDEARSKYTEKHPEVQRLEEEVKIARAGVDTAGRVSAEATENARLAAVETDPAYQYLVAESSLARLRIQALERTQKQLVSDIGQYERRLDAAPMVEQAISSLQREYDLERETHKQLSEKHAAAVVQEQLARSHGGERFSVLSSASLPETPESPKRGRILLIGVALGAALGGGLAYARELLDRSILDAKMLQSEFDVPVLVEIPRLPETG